MDDTTQGIYNRIWENGWDAGAEWLPAKKTQYRLSLELMKRYPLSGHVLDVGGGNASFWRFAQGVRKNIISLTICDISTYALKKAQEQGISTVVMDIASFSPAYAKQFDSICCFEVMEHIREDEEAIKNCFRMLKPGGYFYLSVPRSLRFWSKADEISHHIRRYETGELIQKLKNSSFHINWVFTWGFSIFRLYQKLKGNMSLSFGRKNKNNRGLQLLSYFLYHLFKLEDLFHSNGGMYLYIVAQKPLAATRI